MIYHIQKYTNGDPETLFEDLPRFETEERYVFVFNNQVKLEQRINPTKDIK